MAFKKYGKGDGKVLEVSDKPEFDSKCEKCGKKIPYKMATRQLCNKCRVAKKIQKQSI